MKYISYLIHITYTCTYVPLDLALTRNGKSYEYVRIFDTFNYYIFLVGSSNEITIGPTAIMAIITYTYTHGKPPEYAVILCFLTGLVTLLMGVFQLGTYVEYN